MASNGSVMSRIRQFETGADDHTDATFEKEATAVHPFNRPIGNNNKHHYTTQSSPAASSQGDWHSFGAKSAGTVAASPRGNRTDSSFRGKSPSSSRASPVWDSRMDTDDVSGRNNFEEDRFGFEEPVAAPSPSASKSIESEASSRHHSAWDESGSIDDADWPPVTAGNAFSNERGVQASVASSSTGSSSRSQSQPSRSSRLQTMRSRVPALPARATNTELKRNLDDASVVMQEEKASSIGSRSSSSRSSLSSDELGTVAIRALKLSKVHSQTRATRLQNSPLHQMLIEKRTRKYAAEEPATAPAQLRMNGTVEMRLPPSSHGLEETRNDSNSVPGSIKSGSNSSMRLSARLSRVEKFASKLRYTKQHQDDASSVASGASSQQPESTNTATHPVFGYSKGQSTTDRDAGLRDPAEDKTQDQFAAFAGGNEESSNSSSSFASREKPSRAQRAKALKGVIKRNRLKHGNRGAEVAVQRGGPGSFAYQADEIMLAANSSTFESYSDQEFHAKVDHAGSSSPSNAPSDIENSMLLGEGIAQTSSGDESGLNWSVTTDSASGITPFSQLQDKASSSKMSSGESASQRLDTILDEDTAMLAYTDTSSGPEASKSVSDSSSSRSGSKPDALRWWQKNYGKKMSGPTNSVVHNALSQLSPNSKAQQDTLFFKIDDTEDEEDDVFFGLEDETRFSAKVANQEHFSSEEEGGIGIPIPAPAVENEEPPTDNEESRDEASLNTPPLQECQPLRSSHRAGPNSGMLISNPKGGGSVTSDITSSIIAGKSRKSSWYRPENVATIREESVEEDQNVNPGISAQSTEDHDHVLDETVADSVGNTTKGESVNESDQPVPPGAVFLTIGCAIVDSLSSVCQVPDSSNVRDPTTDCAEKTKDVCELEQDNNDCTFREDSTRGTYSTFKADQDATAASGPSLNTMNEEERRLWGEWDQRDEQSTLLEPMDQLPSRVESGSTSDASRRRERQHQRRQLAQVKLLEHANKALVLQSSKSTPKTEEGEPDEPLDTAQTGNELKLLHIRLAKPTEIKSPSNRSTTSAMSLDERNILEKFSSTLKNEGVEVLKLNQRNRWQTRFLTVSREVTWMNAQEKEAQCPKALLWLKRFKGMSYGVSHIKKQGRGGILFTKLHSVELTAGDDASRPLPNKSKASYPNNACVSLNYSFEGGNIGRSVSLRFKSLQDAETFCSAMMIIKDVVERDEDSV